MREVQYTLSQQRAIRLFPVTITHRQQQRLSGSGVCLAVLIDHLNERKKGVRPADMVKLRAAIKLQNGNITKTDNRTGLLVNLIEDEITTSVDVDDDDFLSEDD